MKTIRVEGVVYTCGETDSGGLQIKEHFGNNQKHPWKFSEMSHYTIKMRNAQYSSLRYIFSFVTERVTSADAIRLRL